MVNLFLQIKRPLVNQFLTLKSNTHRMLCILILIALPFFPTLPACKAQYPTVNLTEEEQAWLDRNASEIRLFFNTEFPPIEFATSSNTFIGMGADIINLVEKKLGIDFVKQPCEDWNKHLAALENGTCAIAPTIVDTPERERYAFFTTPYATVPVVIITRKSISGNLTLSDFTDKRIAVVSGFATENYVRERVSDQTEILTVSDVPEGLRAVSFGRVDALIENLAVAAYFIDQEGIPNLRVAGATDYAFAWSIGISRHYPLLYSAIQKTLDTFSESELAAIRKQWVSLDVPPRLSPEARLLLKASAGFALLLLISLTVITYILKRRLNEKVANLKTAQKELLDHADRLKLATEATQAGIWDFYPVTSKRYLSGQWLTMLGYPPTATEIQLNELKRFIHPEDRASFDEIFEKYLSSGGKDQLEIELRLRRADGTWSWVLSKAKSVEWDEYGAVTRIIGLDINIQNIKEHQNKLAQSEARFRAIFENAPYAIIISDPETGHVLSANNTFLKKWGLGKKDLAAFDLKTISDGSNESVSDIIKILIETGAIKDRETTITRDDGSIGHLIFSSVVIDIDGRKQILSMTVDITEQKHAEQALKESEERFRALFKLAPIPMATISLDGRILDVNDRMTQVMGYTLADVPTLTQWWQLALPDQEYRNQVIAEWDAGFDRVSTSVKPFSLGEIKCTRKDGTELTMIVGTNRIKSFIVVSFFDITGRKRAEEEKENLREQLLQSQKLEAIGVLAGGVAHDFNNMMGAIIGYAELMLIEMDRDNPFRENLSIILDTALHSADLTRQLLAFARKQPIAPKRIDLNKSVESLLPMIKRIIGENIDLIWLPNASPCPVKLDNSQFDQVLTNLCVNARRAIADIGNIIIETDQVSFDETYCEFHPGFLPGDYVKLSVSDNGYGMDKETLEHIFEPFFTTSTTGHGTGLGLSTVYGIIKQNKGFINVYSEPEEGTNFRIYLPRHEAEDEEHIAESTGKIQGSQDETILIVEDDPILLQMTTIMVQRLGYTTLSAGSPGEAINMARTHPDDIHLFITDLIMPEMNGRQLADQLQEIRPEIKHLFMSGYTANVIVHQGVLDKDVNFIEKPFSFTAMADKIREVLD